MTNTAMIWAKLNVKTLSGSEMQLINLAEYRSAVPGDDPATESKFIHSFNNPDGDIVVMYSLPTLITWMQPVLIQEDPSGSDV